MEMAERTKKVHGHGNASHRVHKTMLFRVPSVLYKENKKNYNKCFVRQQNEERKTKRVRSSLAVFPSLGMHALKFAIVEGPRERKRERGESCRIYGMVE